MNHKKRRSGKVAYSLSRRVLIVQEVQLESMGVEALKAMCVEDQYFKEKSRGSECTLGQMGTYMTLWKQHDHIMMAMDWFFLGREHLECIIREYYT